MIEKSGQYYNYYRSFLITDIFSKVFFLIVGNSAGKYTRSELVSVEFRNKYQRDLNWEKPNMI